MKVKLTLERRDGDRVDLAVTVDPTTSVSVLASMILARDPTRSAEPTDELFTLAPVSAAGVGLPLTPDASVRDAGLRSGSTFRVVPAERAGGEGGGAASRAVATMRVLTGPDAGREVPLSSGTAYIGRDPGCDVVLTDPLVSKQHAKLHITTVPELIDTASSNGIIVDGELVQRVVLRPDDVALLGDTTIAVAMHGGGGSTGVEGTAIEFNRSPRISPIFAGSKLESPDLPQLATAQRLPIVTMIAPIVMGAALYFTTGKIISFVMVAISPLMYLGNFLEGRASRKRSYERELEAFRAALGTIEEELAQLAAEEQAVRLGEQPPTSEIAGAVEGLRPLVWTRRRGETGFLQLRLGLGRQPSRTTLELPQNAKQRGDALVELVEVRNQYAYVDGVPVVADLKEKGVLGISGDDEVALDLARGVIAQLAGLHSPAEVVIAAVASAVSAPGWDWLKWLPHVGSSSSPIESPHLAVGRAACLNLVAEIEALVASRAAIRSTDRTEEVRLVLLVEDDAPIDRSRLVAIAEHGRDSDVHVVWHAPATELLPAACRTVLEVDRNDSAVRAVYVDNGVAVETTDVERISEVAALALARRMSPLVDASARVADESDLPRSVSFVTLAGPELAFSPAAVLERWTESNSVVDRSPGAPRRRLKESGLRAVIGRSATDTQYVDLRMNGPHALVGGTTGSGKSELLQSWIIGMAAAYSPDRITFLLVDYKGGSAFGDCKDLPHTVGMVTDLSLHLARRALTSLVAELRYREHILSRKRAKDLIELERTGDPETPPSLVIVIDEFAALVQELPEFVDGVVNVAQRGRSLGLHLILATQRPAGVIKDNLRANTNLRITLRMADEADSIDVLGSPVAASFDPSIPGRAMAKLGPGRLAAFQAAYVGGHTSAHPPPPAVVIEELTFGQPHLWDEPEKETVEEPSDPGPTDIRRLVETITGAAAEGGIPAPRLPWLAELAPIYELRRLSTSRKDAELAFGVRDDPDNQAQPVAVFYPDTSGNMVIYGTGGSGKSTALRTFATAAAFNLHGGPCHVYGLDFGSHGLDAIADLPHVGAVVTGDDLELLVRLLRRLRATIDDRAARYAKVKAGTITEYRKLASQPDEPRILLLVDSVGGFRQGYEVGENSKWWEIFTSIAQDGRPVGVHVLVSADRPAALSSALASTMQETLVLRMASDNDLAMLGVRPSSFGSEVPPGRGFKDGLELQVAVLGGSGNIAEQARAVERLGEAMRRADVPEAPPVERLRDHVLLSELPTEVNDLPVIGLSDETLGPLPVVPRGTFVISGPPGSGRTTALATLGMALRRWRPDSRVILLGQQQSALADIIGWSEVALGADQVAALSSELAATLGIGKLPSTPVTVVVEGVCDFLNTGADMPLQGLAKALMASGGFLVTDGEPGAISGSWPLLQAVKESRYGVALQPEQAEGLGVYKTNFPRVNRAQFPAGRGLLVGAGRTSIVQLALPG